jgi:HAD superfamily hydrolase (TIGR01662 family)
LLGAARAAGLGSPGNAPALGLAAGACAAGWAGLTAQFAAQRVMAGPRTWQECGAMVATSLLIPPLAVGHWLAGTWRSRHAGPWPPRPAAVLFDRDGTLICDVPYNGDPARVEAMPGAAAAVTVARRAGLRVGVVSNQSGVGTGRITMAQAEAVNRRVDELLGPFDAWLVCPHAPSDGCACRKPAPGLILAAADRLGLAAADCVVLGDIGADVAAARAAGARGILVPAPATRTEELADVPCAPSLPDAVAAVLTGRLPPSWPGGEQRDGPWGRMTQAYRTGGSARAYAEPMEGSKQHGAHIPAGGGDRRRRVPRATGLSAPA